MSYSITAQGATKHAAKQDAAKKLAEALGFQEVHKADAGAIHAATAAFIDALDEPVTPQLITVNVNGWASSSIYGSQGPANVAGVNFTITATVG